MEKDNKNEVAALEERVKELEAQLGNQTGFPPNTHPPIVIDLGRKKKKHIKALKRGEGRLLDEVREALSQVRTNLTDNNEDNLLVPVVMVYRRKYGRRNRLFEI